MTKVLVVDDEPFLKEMLYDIFTMAGYDVITAENGKEGLDKIYGESPDFVILDCSMPIMDGFEVLTIIRKEARFVNLPVIMLTALAGDAEQIKGLSLGVDDYITKPFKSSVLLTKVKNILERKKQSLDVNPLTSLPGNVSIQKYIESKIASKSDFSILYFDLANFKSFNDKYGFFAGDNVIRFTASVLEKSLKEFGKNDSCLIGHIGGDDFVVISPIDLEIKIAEKVIELFDAGIKDFYNKEDLEKGYIVSIDRNDNIQNFPIMTISISIIVTNIADIVDFEDVAQRASELKKIAKKNSKSSYVFERRKYGR
ncbi:MAG: response regulator [Endomicrobiaceae bacterium]|nr:response regulator [Endomicrobiaceae bacterium]